MSQESITTAMDFAVIFEVEAKFDGNFFAIDDLLVWTGQCDVAPTFESHFFPGHYTIKYHQN